MNLSNIFYISDFEINLFSENFLYQNGLHENFDKYILYIHAENGSLILKTVKQNSIYIVNWITENLQNSAFHA